MCIGVSPACISMTVPNTLELEIQTVVSCHVGSKNSAQICWEPAVLLTAELSMKFCIFS